MARTNTLNNYLTDIASAVRDIQNYQFVDYIESSGTQYIDTEYQPNSTTTKVIVDGVYLNTDTGHLAGITYNGYYYGLRPADTSKMRWHDGTGSGAACFIDFNFSYLNNRCVYEYRGRNLYIDNTLKASTTTTSTNYTYNLYLFARNNTGSMDSAAFFRMYSCKIYDGNVLVKDFAPCVRKSDGAIGMYDKLNDIFYENAGTGVFTRGSNVDEPIPATKFDKYINRVSSTNIRAFFHDDFAGSSYTKDQAGLKSFIANDYFKPEYYPLAVDTRQCIGSGAYKNNTSEFYVPSLSNMSYDSSYVFSGCVNAIFPPDFTVTIAGTSTRPAEAFLNTMHKYTGDVNITLNAATYWPDNLFADSFKIGDDITAPEKHLTITFNYTTSSAAGTFGNIYRGILKNKNDATQPSNYTATFRFRGLSDWTAISGTSWSDGDWDYYCRMFANIGAKSITVDGLKFVSTTYRAHRMFQESLSLNIEFINCSFSGSYNFKRWFYNCKNLQTLDLSSIINTHPTNVELMFYGCTSLRHIDLRSFALASATTITNMFGPNSTEGVPDDCEIIVADSTNKTWVETNFPRLTNVKTVADYVGGY